MNIGKDVILCLLEILAVILILFLLFKVIWEVYRRLKGKDLELYDEDVEMPYGVSSRYFASAFFAKLLYQLISVKVWGIVAGTAISTVLALKNFPRTIISDTGTLMNVNMPLLSGAQWTTFNTTIWALIFGMKEVFKVAERRSKQEARAAKELQEAQAQQELALEEAKTQKERIVLSQLQTHDTERPTADSEGHELVGDEPDGEA